MSRYLAGVCLLLICLHTGCKSSKTKQAAGNKEANTANDDTRLDRLAAGKEYEGDKAEEARAWLNPKNTNNSLWKTSRAQTMQYVNEFYEAGAVKVFAVYMPKDGTVPVNLCAELFLTLPSDKEKRKKVIRAFNKVEKELWGEDADRVKDEGQKYLYLNMDP